MSGILLRLLVLSIISLEESSLALFISIHLMYLFIFFSYRENIVPLFILSLYYYYLYYLCCIHIFASKILATSDEKWVLFLSFLSFFL